MDVQENMDLFIRKFVEIRFLRTLKYDFSVYVSLLFMPSISFVENKKFS